MEPDFGIGEVVNRLKRGKTVARRGWNGFGQELRLQVPDDHSSYVYIKTEWGHCMPWLTSQMDLLAEDWYEVLL